MAPPRGAKEFMRFKWAGGFFDDDTEETQVRKRKENKKQKS